jgi:hypothetical protein
MKLSKNIFLILLFMTINAVAADISKMKQSSIVLEVGKEFIAYSKHDNVTASKIDVGTLVTEGDELYFNIGVDMPYVLSNKFGTEIGLRYINIENKSHTVAFYGKITYFPFSYKRGNLYLEGAFGGGVDNVESKIIQTNDGSYYKSTDNPQFLYTRIAIGTNYRIYKNLIFDFGIALCGRSYDMEFKQMSLGSLTPMSILDGLDIENKSLNSNSVTIITGLKYKF